MAGLGKHWNKISKSYHKIPKVYESTNKLISLNRIELWRKETTLNLLNVLAKKINYLVLDAGSGPGNMLDTLAKTSGKNEIEGIMFDYSVQMMNLSKMQRDKVQGVFENMPFRNDAFDGIIMGLSMHAAVDTKKAISELARVTKSAIAIVSAGSSKSASKRNFTLFYMKHIVPKIALITAGDKAKEFANLHRIYKYLPTNAELIKIFSEHFEIILFKELMMGSIYEFIGTKKKKSGNK